MPLLRFATCALADSRAESPHRPASSPCLQQTHENIMRWPRHVLRGGERRPASSVYRIERWNKDDLSHPPQSPDRRDCPTVPTSLAQSLPWLADRACPRRANERRHNGSVIQPSQSCATASPDVLAEMQLPFDHGKSSESIRGHGGSRARLCHSVREASLPHSIPHIVFS
ncbi:hypothetical protein BD309DRAFT_121318 [Dichomitus squalens]|uniref:Uncharacterized protein n=1 Tax=Dichomitus squalens TaxID=114155 RepID=A0A4Q9P504_9APHY|nr:hypothetical protein BD309DRAFT_121318 [Dichomitus squalens]TBU60907.1 hypothetical protein BD310DRAFT_251297 [Dichomitus squalens]